MDPFVLSRNAFNNYCSEYLNTTPTNKIIHENAVQTLNQRFEYFLQTLGQLHKSMRNSNMNSNSLLSVRNKRKNKKLKKQQMPKVYITVSCAEHQAKQQPNIKFN